MSDILLHADDVMRGRSRFVSNAPGWRTAAPLLALILLFGSLYGAAMGTFGGVAGARGAQMLFSAVKVPLLVLVTMVLSLPTFFVVHTLVGLRADFPHAVRAVLAGQAGVSVMLSSLAPFTLLWYASSASYSAAILFNALMFGVASVAGQRLLLGYYGPLLARDARHRWLLRMWLVMYAFVGIQMGWVLRPFIGVPGHAVRFFREDSWGNAYVVVAGLIRNVLGH